MLVRSLKSDLFDTARQAVTMCMHDELIPSHIDDLVAAFEQATPEQQLAVFCSMIGATSAAFKHHPELWQKYCAKWELRAA